MFRDLPARLGRRLTQTSAMRQLIHRIAHPIWMGNLRRRVPVTRYGWERGTPIDRYYIELFLKTWSSDIRGNVLEIRDRTYATRYGGTAVTDSQVIDIDSSNPEATIIADLSAAENVASEICDCFILTQTLQYIYDIESAVRHAHRILREGGVLLVTMPVIACIESRATDYWRLTPLCCHELFSRYFGADNVQVFPYGNALTAISYLSGLALEEFRPAEIDVLESNYPVVSCVRAIKKNSV